MSRSATTWTGWIASAMFLCVGVGCATTSTDSAFSLKNLGKPKTVEQAGFTSEMEELPATPKHPEKLKLAYARLMEETGRTEEAHAQFAEVVKDHPKNVEALLGLARADQRAGHLVEAERGLKKAVKIAPDDAEAQYLLGQFYASQEKWPESVGPLTKAMLASPQNTNYRYQLAVSLVHAGDIDSALPHFIRTIGDAEAHYNVGLILQQSGKLDDAERHFLIAVNKKPELKQAQHWLTHLRENRPQGESGGAAEDRAQEVIPASHRSAKLNTEALLTPGQATSS